MSAPSFIKRPMVGLARGVLRGMGLRVHRISSDAVPPDQRPVGSMSVLLEDIKRRKFEPRAILDVGANCGDWSRMAAGIFPDASLILVEPQQEMRVHLEKFCRDFPQARHVEAGAGAEAGELILTVWDDLAGSSFLPVESASTPPEKRRSIKIITIDSLYDDSAEIPSLVKMDIQGFELEALKGAQKLFGRTELFILEASLYEFMPKQPLFSEVVGYMARMGYEVYDLPGFLRRPSDGAMGQVDIAFARRDGFLRSSGAW